MLGLPVMLSGGAITLGRSNAGWKHIGHEGQSYCVNLEASFVPGPSYMPTVALRGSRANYGPQESPVVPLFRFVGALPG